MRESELLAHIEARSRDLSGQGAILIGPGDDCAVLNLSGPTLATVDHLVAGRHFDPARLSVDQIARKAIARSLSDIAAMAGRPVVALATACLPTNYAASDELFDSMAKWARLWGCPLAGGDIAIAEGPMVLTVTILGQPHPKRGAVLRSGARAGDLIFVTGRIGASLQSGRHASFEPRVPEGWWLADQLGESLRSMIDLSDGLGRDAGRIGVASNVQLEIESAKIPLHLESPNWREATSDGEDYELLFTVEAGTAVPPTFEDSATPITCIGRVNDRGPAGVIIIEGTNRYDASQMGWDHQG